MCYACTDKVLWFSCECVRVRRWSEYMINGYLNVSISTGTQLSTMRHRALIAADSLKLRPATTLSHQFEALNLQHHESELIAIYQPATCHYI
ncbi:uncharacterized protein BDZ99DRAFT_181586 [Mytilinidion resinicola]|uniref:Uncharacterized protein n=1 Tax=Mytilinidion resinicola TaxID=574789 RepID=A0A6A6Z0D8_9PEZI|nr:uncharacterized protein BDZ99DRAFT_181586 [Mytilinidion resinicola]KAF2814646.1 hypothetical protein BDZ99DRAFT_181586 [Mytilinidion resinicola]